MTHPARVATRGTPTRKGSRREWGPTRHSYWQRPIEPPGFTLLEVIVVVALLAVLTAISGVAVVSLRSPSTSEVLRGMKEAQAGAIRTGQMVTWVEGSNRVVFYPDGSSGGGLVTIDTIRYAVDPLSGELHAVD